MTTQVHPLSRRTVAEGTGTALLLVAVVGSGTMAERLSGGNAGLALLANAVATGGALVALILAFGPISGAHLNPAVTIADASRGGLPWRAVPAYLLAQVVGAFLGVALAHGMFELPAFTVSTHGRAGAAQVLSEAAATFGLLSVIWGVARARPGAVPFAVAAYITGAYWFTASTAFANPAVTLARAATNTFAGIRPGDVPGFLLGQLIGATAATLLFRWLSPRAIAAVAPDVVVPHSVQEPSPRRPSNIVHSGFCSSAPATPLGASSRSTSCSVSAAHGSSRTAPAPIQRVPSTRWP